MSTTLTSAKAPQSSASGENVGGGAISQVVSFRLGKEEYALDIMRVQEIILLGEITEIPEVPSYIRGLINLRGQVIPIVDLRRRFKLDIVESNEHTRIIVVNANDHTFGIVVDAVSEVLRINEEQIEPPPPGLVGVDQAYICGLVKLEDKIMILLKIAAILSQEDQNALAGAATPAS